MIEKRINLNKLIEQGDIYKDIKLFRNIQVNENDVSVDEVKFSYVVVLSQTCDLERLYDKNPNSVLSVLVAPLFLLEQFKDGTYLDFVGIQTETIKKEKALKPYINGEKPRYYVVSLDEETKLQNSQLICHNLIEKNMYQVSNHFIERNYRIILLVIYLV